MKQFRKILAVLLSMLMLCTMMPAFAMVRAATNLITNGDFENGATNWTLHNDTDTVTEVVDDPTGFGRGKVIHGVSTYDNTNGRDDMFYQQVSLEANTDYVLTLKVYCYSTASNAAFIVNFYDKDNGGKVSYNTADVTGLGCQNITSSSAVRVRLNVTSNTNKWVDITIPFNSGDAISPRILISNYRVKQGYYYFDDIVLTKVGGDSGEGEGPDTPVDPDPSLGETDVTGNLLVNGNFGTGDLTGWTNLYGNCATSVVEGYNSTYGLQVTASGAWNMVRQKVNVEENTDYVLTIWAKAASNMTLLVKDGGDTTNIAQAGLTGTDWTKYTIKFNSGDYSSIYVCVMAGQADATAIVDSASLVKGSNNVLQNGDFETGDTTGWTNLYGACTISMTGGHTGSYGLDFQGGQWNQVRQKVSVQANTNYVLSGWAKDATSVSFLVKDGGDTTNIAQISTNSGSAWKKYRVTFNTGEYTSIYVGMMAGGNGGSAIIDDVSLEKEEATVENLSTNGDFETGDLTGWTKYQSTAVSASAARNGSYGVSIKGPGDWGGTFDQQLTVVEGRSYQISFWYKTVSNGMNFCLRNSSKVNLLSAWLKETIWTKYEGTFVADDDTVNIHFNGSGKGTTDEIYVDDVVVIDLSNSGNRAEVLSNDGSSIRDTADDNRGLAFRFSVNVTNAQVTESNQLVPNMGSIKLFKHNDILGTLVGTGAIVTNQVTVGTGDMTHESVDGKKTIDIPVKYLLDLSEDSLTYAVRIVNIPDHATQAEIYARPYYTYDLNGEQVTVYGDIVHNNYADVDSNRRAVRVLTIGDEALYDSIDTYLYDMLYSAEYEEIILGHLNPATNTYYKNDNNGTWVTTAGMDADTAITDERWQYVVVNDGTLVDWAETNKTESTAQVLWHMDWEGDFTANAAAAQAAGTDGVVAVDTALENLSTVNVTDLYDGNKLNDNGEYVACLNWFVTLTEESLDLVDDIPEGIAGSDDYNMRRAAVHAYAAPDKVTDLTEVVLISGSDYQYYGSTEDGLAVLKGLTDSVKSNTGYGVFDGLLFGGDYTITLGSDYDDSNAGLNLFDSVITDTVNFDKYYTQGNHDAAGIDLLPSYGNNDNPNAPYGVFIIHEDNYNAYGSGGQQVAADLTAYCNEKLQSGWGNKPIFVTSHIPLHFNARTIKDGMASSAVHVVNALNAASEAGLNIIFLIGHNHGSGYDDYLGGGSVYIPKGETIVIPDPSNPKVNAPIETELKFTYMNFGYVSSYGTSGTEVDTALTMCTFRIQENGDVIITRYDKNGVHNLKSAGKVSPSDESGYTFDDERVYESSRIVTADDDRKYEE